MKEHKDYAAFMNDHAFVMLQTKVIFDGLICTQQSNAALPCGTLHGGHAHVLRNQTR
jgi:hypothetical protein